MGDVVSFGNSRISIEEFDTELKNPAAFERVAESIGRICKFADYHLSTDGIDTRIRFNSPENDVLSYVRDSNRGLIVSVPGSFPQALVDGLGFDDEVAIQLATDYSLAYGQYSYCRARRKFKSPSFVGSQVDDIWQSRYLSSESRSFIPPYRFAGAVAIRSAKVLEIPISGLTNQPPHIAGILNPLSRGEARSLHGILRA